MPSAAQREKFRVEGRCLMCGGARDLPGERCSSCLASVTLSVAKQRAKRKGLSFSLTKGWLQQETAKACPCCGETMRRGGDRSTSPSIDRMDNTRGYDPANCWVICFSCNEAKSNALSPVELLEQAQRAMRIAQVWESRCV